MWARRGPDWVHVRVWVCYLGDAKMTTEVKSGGGGTMPQKVHYLLTCVESVYFTQVSLKLESCYVYPSNHSILTRCNTLFYVQIYVCSGMRCLSVYLKVLFVCLLAFCFVVVCLLFACFLFFKRVRVVHSFCLNFYAYKIQTWTTKIIDQ